MAKHAIITKTHFYASVIAAGMLFASCNGHVNSAVPPPPADNVQPVVQPLQFSKPKKIAWAAVKAVPAQPVITKLAWDKLPEQASDTLGFMPFKYPVQETTFDYNALPGKPLDIDKVASQPIKFKTYVLPPPKLVKGARPQLKGGYLYLMPLDEDQTSSGGVAVTRVLNGSDGFLWILCSEGLYRFDGENLLLFLSFSEDQNDYGIVQDSLGNIWIANSVGPLMIVDTKAGILKKSIPNQGLDGLQHLMIDRRQRIWATCQTNEVKIIDPKTQTVKILNGKNGLYAGNRTAGIAEDKSGKIWISTGGGGISIIDPESKIIKHIDQAHGLSSDRVNNILFDRRGRLWAGMYGGVVHVIDFQKKSIQTISEAKPASGVVLVACLYEDDRGRVWVGTTGNGVTVIKPEQRMAIHLTKSTGLAGNGVLDITQDDAGQVWIGTGEGLNMTGNTKAVVDYAGANFVTNLMEDGHGHIWQATFAGADIWDRTKKTMRHLGVKQGLANDTVHFIAENNGCIFINTAKSVDIVDTAKKTITHLKSNYGNILFDKGGRLYYLDAEEKGINVYDPENQTLKHFGPEMMPLNDYIYFTCLDARGRIWLSNAYGQVWVVDPGAGTSQFLTNIKRGKKNSSVHFLPDDKGNVWIGTDKGIYLADIKSQTLLHFSAAQGLINNNVLSMVQHNGSVYTGTGKGVTVITPPAEGIDAKKGWRTVSYAINKPDASDYNADLVTRDGIYWSGNAGATGWDLAKKAPAVSSPYIKGFSLFDHPVYFFDKTRFSRSGADTLWRPNGETWFAKDETPASTSYAFKSGLRWDDVSGPNNTPVNLQIPYNQNFIHFHYGNLNLAPHDTTRYRYILGGVDKNWSDITTDTTTVNYMNLQPGNYTFEVISQSTENVWSRPVAFSFTVNPPWWQTWWAYIIYVFVFAGAIWGLVRYRSYQLIKDKRMLEDKVNLATEEITQQKEEISSQRDSLETQRNDLEKTLVELKATQTQLVQSEKMASLGELTAGIAHEIQNPLNFVNNFSEVSAELIDELGEELDKGDIEEAKAIAVDVKQNLEKIRHHGKRADGIVKGMLEHSRAGSGQKEPIDLNKLVDEYMRLAYHGLRAKNKEFNANLVTTFDEKLPHINVIPQDIGRIMLNLFNNAFYAVNQKAKTVGAGYKPEVSVATSTENGQVIIKVRDNGIGIPDAVKDKIMQPFFTTKPTGEGTGLGLSLAYDMVVKGHDGRLEIDSKEGEYTVFTISLPIN